jgi:shikimate dehydrogenase
MGIKGKAVHKFGLIGKDISYSFSKNYFTQKFKDLGLDDHIYENFDLNSIEQFQHVLDEHKDLKGLNVTIPYKELIIPYLSKIGPNAKEIHAVNTITFTSQGLQGFNTDCHGFEKAIEPFLTANDQNALILGTGGASKAIAFVLKSLSIEYKMVSRQAHHADLTYKDLNSDIMDQHQLIINCTPLGTFPSINDKPDVPYEHLNSKHLLFDLIYNPRKTTFLKLGEQQGARITNGLEMLKLQAEASWNIWNS